MKYTIADRAAPVVTIASVLAELRIEPEDAQRDKLIEDIEAATDYAETQTHSALGDRQVVATFYAGEPLRMPVVPTRSITSVVDGGGNTMTYTWQRRGVDDVVTLSSSPASYPITITYQAGQDVPAALRRTIRADVVSCWQNGTAYEDGQRAEWIDRTYAAFSWQRPIA